jgi:hypothetical protein
MVELERLITGKKAFYLITHPERFGRCRYLINRLKEEVGSTTFLKVVEQIAVRGY